VVPLNVPQAYGTGKRKSPRTRRTPSPSCRPAVRRAVGEIGRIRKSGDQLERENHKTNSAETDRTDISNEREVFGAGQITVAVKLQGENGETHPGEILADDLAVLFSRGCASRNLYVVVEKADEAEHHHQIQHNRPDAVARDRPG